MNNFKKKIIRWIQYGVLFISLTFMYFKLTPDALKNKNLSISKRFEEKKILITKKKNVSRKDQNKIIINNLQNTTYFQKECALSDTGNFIVKNSFSKKLEELEKKFLIFNIKANIQRREISFYDQKNKLQIISFDYEKRKKSFVHVQHVQFDQDGFPHASEIKYQKERNDIVFFEKKFPDFKIDSIKIFFEKKNNSALLRYVKKDDYLVELSIESDNFLLNCDFEKRECSCHI